MCLCLVAALNGERDSKCKNQHVRATLSPDFSIQRKDLYVRIVHAGGFVDLYKGAMMASLVMEKYPGLHLTRPEVFRQPQKSLVHPEETLQPGQKFYLVPRSTIKKLKRKYPEVFQVDNSAVSRLESAFAGKRMVNIEEEEDTDFSDESVCSAKDFYVSQERWSKSMLRRSRVVRVKKPFVPPIKNEKIWQGLGWEPSLESVEELSP